MPRIYTSTSDPLDFCRNCFPRYEEDAFEQFGRYGDGPDGRGNCFGYNAGHPPYEETDYRCHECRAPLTERDDFVDDKFLHYSDHDLTKD